MIRAAGYYLVHTFLGGIKKLFRTWVASFLLIILGSTLVSALLGITMEALNDREPELDAPGSTEVVETTPSIPGAEAAPGQEDEEDFEEIEEDFEDYIAEHPRQVGRITAGIVLIGSLLAFGLVLIFADRGTTGLFTMPDVHFLFASPWKPQTVLLFRKLLTLERLLIPFLWIGIYGLMLGVGRLFFGIAAGFLLISLCAELLGAIVYLIANSRPGRTVLFRAAGFLLLLAGIAIPVLFYMKSPGDPFALLERIGGWTPLRWIPLAGSVAGAVGRLMAGEYLLCLPGLVGTLLLAALLVFWISKIRCDYYEHGSALAAKMQEVLDLQAQKKQSARRTKDRSDRVRRDVIRHGRGASAFFFRPLDAGRRSALLGIVPPACMVWLVLSLIVAFFTRVAAESHSLVALIALHAMGQYLLSFGNPLGRELGMNFFWLAPEPPGKKLFFALSGELCRQLANLLPGYLIAGLLIGGSPAELLCGGLLIASMTAFCAVFSLLIDLIVPGSLPDAVRLMIQMYIRLQLYLPLLIPFVILLAMGHPVAALLSAALIGLFLSAVAFALSLIPVRRGRK